MSEWKETTWGNVSILEYGKSLKNYQESSGTVPVFGTNGKIGFTDSPPLCKFPSVIIGRKGAYRGVHFSSIPFFVIDTAFYLKPIHENTIDLKFAYYKLLTQNINRLDSGSAIPSTSREDFYQLELLLPPLQEQKQIANILSCLDDKIDNLRRQNETLEKIAQTLFKHWFINFEFPNDDGKPYKSSGGAMVTSELGDIPEGWRVGILGDVITQANTGADAIQKAPIVDEDTGIKCLRIGDITNNKQFEEWGYCKVTEKHFLQYQLKKGDILITRTSALGLNILILKDLNAVFNNGLIKIRIKNNINTFFVYYFMQSKRYKDYIARITYETTTRPNMQINYLLDFPLLFVNKDLEDNFSSFVSKILLKQQKNNEQIQTLTKTRDTLLPKLMSGQIRVKD